MLTAEAGAAGEKAALARVGEAKGEIAAPPWDPGGGVNLLPVVPALNQGDNEPAAGERAGRKEAPPTPLQAPALAVAPDPLAVIPDVRMDLPGYAVKEADCLLDVAYEDHIHDNDRTHLDRRIPLDGEWQAL